MSIAEKLTAIAENEQKVFDAGRQAAYDEFWDKFQDHGNRTNWRNGCSGAGWTDETFKPKYDITPGDAYMMFTNAQFTELPSSASIDFSNCYSLQYCFWGCTKLLRLGTINAQKATLYGAFNSCTSLHTIEKLILPGGYVTESSAYNSMFLGCWALENVAFEGVIKFGGFSLGQSPKLSKASIESVINALSDETTGLTVTLSQTAVDAAFETAEGAADGSASEAWQTLLATKPNWTVTLT